MKGARLLLGLVAVSLATACGANDLTGPADGGLNQPRADEAGATGSGG